MSSGIDDEINKTQIDFITFVRRFKRMVNDIWNDLKEKLPSPEPTQPSSEPTQPSSEPTQPSSEPTQPSPEPNTQQDYNVDATQSRGEIGKKAVVIGINMYEKLDKSKKLSGAENDADEICAILKSNNFEISPEHFLKGERATYRAITKAISDTIRATSDDKIILFYYSGHGLRDKNNDVYIAPYDIDPEDPYVCGICTDELSRVMDDSKNKSKFILILDCCYSGKATKTGKNEKSGIDSIEDNSQGVTLLADNFKKIAESNKPVEARKIILASSKAQQKSFEVLCPPGHGNPIEHYHGIFTSHLIDALTPKDITDEGDIRIDEIYNRIEKKTEENNLQRISYNCQSLTLGSTVIATYGNFDKKIKKILSDAETSLNVKNINLNSLIYIIKGLSELEGSKYNDKMNKEQLVKYDKLKKNLNECLDVYKKKLISWFATKQIMRENFIITSMFGEASNCSWKKLSDLSDTLSYETAGKATLNQLNVLVTIYDFSDYIPIDSKMDDEKKYEVFKSKLELFSQGG